MAETLAEARRTVGSRLVILFGSLVIVTCLAAVAVTRSRTSAVDPGIAVPVRHAPASTAPDTVDRARVEAAIKALDLIRPARQKLAEDFTLKTPDGRTVRLSDQRGKVVLINFWATWCPPCREEMPAMERLFQRTKKKGLVMLAVSVDADQKAITPFLEEHRFTFTVGLDPRMDLANAYGVRALPASFIVDRRGNLAARALGPRDWDSAASQALIEGLSR